MPSPCLIPSPLSNAPPFVFASPIHLIEPKGSLLFVIIIISSQQCKHYCKSCTLVLCQNQKYIWNSSEFTEWNLTFTHYCIFEYHFHLYIAIFHTFEVLAQISHYIQNEQYHTKMLPYKLYFIHHKQTLSTTVERRQRPEWFQASESALSRHYTFKIQSFIGHDKKIDYWMLTSAMLCFALIEYGSEYFNFLGLSTSGLRLSAFLLTEMFFVDGPQNYF